MQNAHYRLKSLNTLFTLATLLPISLNNCTTARSAYKRGVEFEIRRDFEAAMTAYQAALVANPGNTEFRLKYETARYAAALDHFEKSRRAMQADAFDIAKAEYTRTIEIDPTHALAR